MRQKTLTVQENNSRFEVIALYTFAILASNILLINYKITGP